jgi:serine protease AprX
LMLEANPTLSPAEVKDILQRSATPLPPYYTYETGTGMLNVHAAVLEAAYPSRRIGAWRGTIDRNQVEFLSDAPIPFSGTVQPGTTSDISVPVPEGAITATVQISWGPLWSTNDLALAVYDQTGALKGQANAINLTGLNGKHETLSFSTPTAGTWHVKVKNTVGAFGTPQKFCGVLEVGRAEYARLTDIDSFSPAFKSEVYQNLRSFSMWPIGSRFRGEFGVSRLDLATALVLTARVPQYLPGQANYSDVHDPSTRLFVESVQAAPVGSLFIDAAKGGQFRPNVSVTRLAAAVALVRAAGLRSDAEAKAGTPLPFLDAAGVPNELKGYVSVAVSAGLLQGDTNFRPQAGLSRAELAHALTVIETRAVQ